MSQPPRKEKKLSKDFLSLVKEAAETIARGGIVILPTDTVYGIVGDARNVKAVRAVFAMKGRPVEKAFPVFLRDIDTARKFAYISDAKAEFLTRVWPGAVTVVLEHKEKLPAILTGRKNTLGIRIPESPFLRALLEKLDFPLLQTSANISGKPPAKNIEEIKTYFEKGRIKPDLMIDGGKIDGRPSTVIDFTGKKPILLRSGLLAKEELDSLMNFVQKSD